MSGRARQGRRALLGGAIILGLMALAAGIFLLDDIAARFRSSYQVVAVLPEAPRLVPGSRVWVAGSDVGDVRTVALLPARPDGEAAVALVLRLPGRVRAQVRQDSRVRITSVNLLGAPVVDISPGNASAAALRPGDTLYAARQPSGAAVLARAARFRSTLDSALAELRALQGPAERRLASYQRVRLQLAAAQAEYQHLRDQLQASPLAAGWRSGELSTALDQGRATVTELLRALASVQERMRASGLSANASALGARTAALQRSLAALQDTMRQGGGTLDRLGRDSALVRALAGARLELDSLLADVRRRPLRYVF